MFNRILDDQREIKRITFPVLGGDECFYEIGMNIGDKKITKILPYEENGEMASIIWFAIYVGDEILYRVNSKYIDTVQY